MNAYKIILLSYFVLCVFVIVNSIGKRRPIVTPALAMISLVILGVEAALVALA